MTEAPSGAFIPAGTPSRCKFEPDSAKVSAIEGFGASSAMASYPHFSSVPVSGEPLATRPRTDRQAVIAGLIALASVAFASAEAFLSSDRVLATACVIADVQMPGMSGLELQARLIRDGHRVPFIFITAFPNEQARCRAMHGGAVSFLSKPFGETELLEGIGLALESSTR